MIKGDFYAKNGKKPIPLHKKLGKRLRNQKLDLSKNRAKEKSLKAPVSKADKKSEKESKLEQDLVQLRKALKESENEKLYLRAEFENFKKRTFEEQNQLYRFGGEKFIVSLANEVLDDLDRAFFFRSKKYGP